MLNKNIQRRNMLSKIKAEQIIVLIAILVGLAGVALYYFSGQGSYEQQKRVLQNADPTVREIVVEDRPEGQKTIEVKCQDGTSYEIYLPPGETSYDALSASKC